MSGRIVEKIRITPSLRAAPDILKENAKCTGIGVTSSRATSETRCGSCLLSLWCFIGCHRITYGIDGWLLRTGRIDDTTAFFGLTMVGARSALDTIVTLNLSFLVFTFGSLLVAIQVAGGQYTPRIIATTLLRDNAIRFTVGYFVFTLLFTVRVLTRMGGEIVHQFNTFIAGVLGLVSIVVFLYLIDYAARFLRPVSIVKRVGESGIAVIQSVYPESTTRPPPRRVVPQARIPGANRRQCGCLGDRARR